MRRGVVGHVDTFDGKEVMSLKQIYWKLPRMDRLTSLLPWNEQFQFFNANPYARKRGNETREGLLSILNKKTLTFFLVTIKDIVQKQCLCFFLFSRTVQLLNSSFKYFIASFHILRNSSIRFSTKKFGLEKFRM